MSGLCPAIRPNHEPLRGSAQFAPNSVSSEVGKRGGLAGPGNCDGTCADLQMQLILSREAREPVHLHWMNDCARHKETCASAVHHARTVRCGSVLPVSRRGTPRLEPDVRSSRFVIVREIHDATPFRVATFTRTTPPFHEMPNTTPIGLFSHRDDSQEERSTVFKNRTKGHQCLADDDLLQRTGKKTGSHKRNARG